MRELEKRRIEFLANQDGQPEAEFMPRLSDTVFPEFLTEVRDAYLLSVRYDNDPQCFVAVCIVTAEWANEDAIRRTVQNEIAKMISSMMSLEIVFPNEKRKAMCSMNRMHVGCRSAAATAIETI